MIGTARNTCPVKEIIDKPLLPFDFFMLQFTLERCKDRAHNIRELLCNKTTMKYPMSIAEMKFLKSDYTLYKWKGRTRDTQEGIPCPHRVPLHVNIVIPAPKA